MDIIFTILTVGYVLSVSLCLSAKAERKLLRKSRGRNGSSHCWTSSHTYSSANVFSYLFSVRDVCTGTNAGMTSMESSVERKIQALKNRYENCQYVDGNLEITGLDSEEFYNVDLSFLNSIREVTGYVLIANVYVQNVTLENLTIIRGDTLFHIEETVGSNGTADEHTSGPKDDGYALFVSLNYKKDSDTVGMRLLGLRNLTGKFDSESFHQFTCSLINDSLIISGEQHYRSLGVCFYCHDWTQFEIKDIVCSGCNKQTSSHKTTQGRPGRLPLPLAYVTNHLQMF